MKDIISKLNKEFENRIRLGLMSVLIVNDWVDFNAVKKLIDVTDGNLASHVAALERANYIEVKKEFIGKKPRTSYRITTKGRNAFVSHIHALEKLIRKK